MSLMFSSVTFAQKKPIVLPFFFTALEKWTTAFPVAREITGLSMSLSCPSCMMALKYERSLTFALVPMSEWFWPLGPQ